MLENISNHLDRFGEKYPVLSFFVVTLGTPFLALGAIAVLIMLLSIPFAFAFRIL